MNIFPKKIFGLLDEPKKAPDKVFILELMDGTKLAVKSIFVSENGVPADAKVLETSPDGFGFLKVKQRWLTKPPVVAPADSRVLIG